MKLYYQIFNSPIGPLHIFSSESELEGLYFSSNLPTTYKDYPLSSNKLLSKTIIQLNEYFDGKRKNFNLPLNITGTTFQTTAWNTLLQVSYGKTKSYLDQAKLMKTKAYRAIGSANGKNKFPIIIPCHRIIQSNGGLGGYSGGIKVKKYLLQLESLGLIKNKIIKTLL